MGAEFEGLFQLFTVSEQQWDLIYGQKKRDTRSQFHLLELSDCSQASFLASRSEEDVAVELLEQASDDGEADALVGPGHDGNSRRHLVFGRKNRE